MEQKPKAMTKPFEVVTTDEMTRTARTGGLERFYRLKILTKGGAVQTVDVDGEDYYPEKIQPILTKVAENADKILAL